MLKALSNDGATSTSGEISASGKVSNGGGSPESIDDQLASIVGVATMLSW